MSFSQFSVQETLLYFPTTLGFAYRYLNVESFDQQIQICYVFICIEFFSDLLNFNFIKFVALNFLTDIDQLIDLKNIIGLKLSFIGLKLTIPIAVD